MEQLPHQKFNRKAKILGIGCLVIAGIFVMSSLVFVLIFKKMWKSAQAYENSLTTLTGTFECDSAFAGPISGREATVAMLEYDKYVTNSGNSRPFSDNKQLLFQPPDSRFNVNGKKYKVIGHSMHFFKAKQDFLNAPVLEFQCGSRQKELPKIPPVLKGINHSIDYTFEILERGGCQGIRTSVTFREYLYVPEDTISIRGFVSNDTLFLEE